MDGEMSLLDRLRAERPSESPARRRLRARLDSGLGARFDQAREHAIRSHEPQGWLGGVLIGAWSALLSLLAIGLPLLLAWATARTPSGWGQAVRVATQGWLLVHGVALAVPGGHLHLLPLALSALPLWLCWRAGRRVGASAPRLAGLGPADALRALRAPMAGLTAGYAGFLVLAATLARGSGVRPVWWHAMVAGVVVALGAGGAAAVRVALVQAQPPSARRRVRSIVVEWVQVPLRLRRVLRPALLGVTVMLGVGVAGVVAGVVVQHDRVLAVHHALAPGGPGSVVLLLGQLAFAPDLVLWAVAWCAGPGFAVGVGTAVTPAASTLGLLPLVPVLGALPSPGPLPAPWQAVVLVPVLVGAIVGWRCTRQVPPATAEQDARAGAGAAVLDALVAAALVAAALTVLVLVSSGSAGPGQLSDVGPSAWRVGLALLAELGAGAVATAWVMARRQ
jgi:hypothetical protein